ncbi:MAG: Gfo/Idh/MocA family oxidoreductase [Alphaproteobacteria bacterium]
MYLYQDLLKRAESDTPVRVALIGAGKFGTMFLSQAPTTPGLTVTAIVDLDPERARAACRSVNWSEERIAATHISDDAEKTLQRDDIDVVIEATGLPAIGIRHARMAFANGKHIVMVNVEADVLAGPLLAEEAKSAGVVYSMAYGDQPALICEMVEWARSCGFSVVAAGKGTKYLPIYTTSTPDTVWDYYGLTAEQAAAAGMNSKMFNSFLDGTKSALEMAAVANATGLTPPEDGLLFPPCGTDHLAQILKPADEGGVLAGKGMVEVVSCLERDGRPVHNDLRWGVYVVFEAPNDYAADCFRQYGMNTDSSGRYAAMYKPFHLIGLEVGYSVLSAAIAGRPTGATRGWNGDVVAVAKRDLNVGEVLDGEGGETVGGKVVPSARSQHENALPIGLAHGLKIKRAVPAGQTVSWQDVDFDSGDPAIAARKDMENRFGPGA